MADAFIRTQRAVCAWEALQKYGAQITQDELMRAYAEAGLLPAEMQRNLARGVPGGSAAFDLSEKSSADALDAVPLWAALHCGDPDRAMEAAALDAGMDHDAQSVECAKFLAAAMALAKEKGNAAEALFAAAEYIPEESRTAHLVLDARNLTAQDPEHAVQRIEWRYGSRTPTALSRLSGLVTALLRGERTQDALMEAFYALMGGKEEKLSAEHVVLPAAPKEAQRITVTLMGPPHLSPGKARQCMLNVENSGTRPLFGPVRSRAEGCLAVMTVSYATVMPGQSTKIPLTAWLPEDTEILAERNVLDVQFSGVQLRFGIVGAQGWRVRGRRDGEDWSAWEAFFCEGNRIQLNRLSGWQGPCELEMERRLVIREALQAQMRMTHTCAFALELDGKCIAERCATDGWAQEYVQEDVILGKGEHTLCLQLQRRMPNGWIQMDFIKDGTLLSMEAVNPLKGL